MVFLPFRQRVLEPGPVLRNLRGSGGLAATTTAIWKRPIPASSPSSATNVKRRVSSRATSARSNRLMLMPTAARDGRPPAHRGARPRSVAALADLHFGGAYFDQQRLELVIARTNVLTPDLVVLLGDYGASHLEGAEHRKR